MTQKGMTDKICAFNCLIHLHILQIQYTYNISAPMVLNMWLNYEYYQHRIDKWEEFMPKRLKGRGGPFMCAHLRRKDFIKLHGQIIPTIAEASKQIIRKMILAQLRYKGNI